MSKNLIEEMRKRLLNADSPRRDLYSNGGPIILERSLVSVLVDLAEAAKASAELSPRVPDGNKFGHPWTIPNPVIEPLKRLGVTI